LNHTIQFETVNNCPLCGSDSHRQIYNNLQDCYFEVPGIWNFSQCDDCNLIFLNPRPLDSEAQKCYPLEYANRKTHSIKKVLKIPNKLENASRGGYLYKAYSYPVRIKYLQIFLGSIFGVLPGWKDAAAARVMFLPYIQSGRLLDVGCGSGEFIQSMVKQGWIAEGLDFDKDAVGICLKRGLHVHLGELNKQNFEESSFDAIVLKHVIEHLPNPVTLLKECFKILKPGGKLAVLTPNVESIDHKLTGAYWRGFDLPRHMCLYSLITLKRLIENAGYNVLQQKSISSMDWFNYLSAISLKRNKINIYKSKPAIGSNLSACFFHFYSSTINIWKKNAGDELILIATKT
jgi:2-polyprenyl-3-methyl-5-hydroxy-6-metoxy-1,4-benzoquinol methylase